MSPEQLEGEAADARSDLYAAGLIFYEMATGTNPFIGKTPASTIANILKLEPPPVVERNPAAPAELDRILRKCLRKRPEERYQSARELRVDLANLRHDLTSRSGRAVPEALPATDLRAAYVPLEIPRSLARSVFALIQLGYLVMYGIPLFNPELLEQIHLFSRQKGTSAGISAFWTAVTFLVGICVLAGTPVRLYSLFATAVDYADLGRKYRTLFPVVVVLDVLWAFSPLMLFGKLGMLVLSCIVPLTYLALAQRHLVYSAYSPRGGRTSGLRSPSAPS